jgi:hypothetical protein
MRLSLGCHKASNARYMNPDSDETIASTSTRKHNSSESGCQLASRREF